MTALMEPNFHAHMENTTTLGTPIVCITKLHRTYGEYLMTRLLRKSLDKEFQQYFVGWGKYDEALLQYAYRGGGREEIETRFNKVEEVVKVK